MKALITFLPSSFFLSCLWLLLFSSFCTICFCNQNSDRVRCIPSERLALLDLKHNLTDPANRLSSWVGKDCCTWYGVVCDNFTGHVHELQLRGPDESPLLGGTISPSVVDLLQLRYLDLSNNDFGLKPIPAFIGSFQNLMYLNISLSGFSGEIPHQLGNLTTLRVLDLQSYTYPQSKSLKWLKNLKGLQHLDMSGTDLRNASDWFLVINHLTSLLELHFSGCGLTKLPSNQKRVSFTSLIVLDLSYNSFKGMSPRWIFSLTSLRTLCLSRTTFANTSSLLNGLSSLSNLRLLDASACGISSPILGSLQNMPFIQYIDLSMNNIAEEIPKSFSNGCNFTMLDLHSNKLYGNASKLLESLCECESPKLEVLDLSDNQLIGQLPKRLGKLEILSTIQLASNQLRGTIPDSLGSLSLLQTLDISGNQLSGSIPDTVGGLSSLVSLDLYNNKLNGSLPESIGRLGKLSSLDLSNNKLNGSIPESIGRLGKLCYLDLSNNKLNGSLPESIGRLGKLSSLDLQNNTLNGIVTENHFANLTALLYLYVGDNKLVFKIDVTNWAPPFKLAYFGARSCSLGPQFPPWIQSQIHLTYIDVSNANISDTVPDWLWTTFVIRYLNISHNNIEGKLGDVGSLLFEAELDLSNNHLHGTLPSSFHTLYINFLDLSNNNLSGSLEEFLSCSSIDEGELVMYMRVLNLANNSMSGVIPDCWMYWEDLCVLNLAKNQFSGIIPSSLGDVSSLKSLNLDGNKLSGKLPPWLLNSTSLVIIELAENELTGKIPSSIGRNNTSLRVLSLRSNKLQGKIPDEICHLSSLQILDLAHNNLSGNLPTCFTNFSVISGSQASGPIVLYSATASASLVTKGKSYTYSTILYLVTSLDLSDNKFSGTIPDEVVRLSGLRFLNLSHNNLTGTIPDLFNKTGKFECLDLSMNHLHGNVPLSLSQLTSLNWLNISYNKLVGRIPTSTQLQTFNESSFTGNALCGAPLPACLPNNNVATEGSNHKHDEPDAGFDWILVMLTLAGLVVGFSIINIPLFLSKRLRKAYYHFLDGIWFKLQTFILILSLCLTKRSRSK